MTVDGKEEVSIDPKDIKKRKEKKEKKKKKKEELSHKIIRHRQVLFLPQ